MIVVRRTEIGRFVVTHHMNAGGTSSAPRMFEVLPLRLSMAYEVVCLLPLEDSQWFGCRRANGDVEIHDEYLLSAALDSAGRA